MESDCEDDDDDDDDDVSGNDVPDGIENLEQEEDGSEQESPDEDIPNQPDFKQEEPEEGMPELDGDKESSEENIREDLEQESHRWNSKFKKLRDYYGKHGHCELCWAVDRLPSS
jgi:hypothetical protein